MTRREAKKYVCRCVSEIISGHVGDGAEYLFLDSDGENITLDDRGRLRVAALELSDELHTRGAP